MKAQHLFEDHIYCIRNHSVARNPFFTDVEIQSFFKNKMEKYLGEICQILHYNLNDNEFQILVKLKTRNDFENLYLSKKRNKGKDKSEIPMSTYIFSQQMSNFQVCLVKKINNKFQRSGTLIASRFKRELITNERELELHIKRMSLGEKVHNYSSSWKNRGRKAKKVVTGRWIYEVGVVKKRVGGVYFNGYKLDLVALFKNLPPLSLNPSKKYYFSPLTIPPIP